MSTKILSFYNRILPLAGLTTDVEGFIRENLGKAQRPWTIEGQRVVLPTDSQLRSQDNDKTMKFHPLEESVFRGESEVMTRFRTAINITMNMRLGIIIDELVELAASPKEHGRLKPSHLPLMTILKEADEKTFEDWVSLRKAMPPGSVPRCLTHIYIKKNPHIGSKAYKRGAIVSFPLYEQLSKEGAKGAFDVKLRKKDVAAFKQLFEALFPDMQEVDSYSRGSSNLTAAMLDALLKAVQAVGGQINAVIEQFEDVLPELSSLRYSDDWIDDANNLDIFEKELHLIPAQRGNEGAVIKPLAPVAAEKPKVMAPGMLTTVQPVVQQVAASAITEEGKVNMSALLAANPSMMAGIPGMGLGIYAQPVMLDGAAALRAQGPQWANPVNVFTQNARGF